MSFVVGYMIIFMKVTGYRNYNYVTALGETKSLYEGMDPT